MAYTPTVWATGDVITAAKLNNMENGLTQFVVNFSANYGDLNTTENFLTDIAVDKTFPQIYNALTSGQRVSFILTLNGGTENGILKTLGDGYLIVEFTDPNNDELKIVIICEYEENNLSFDYRIYGTLTYTAPFNSTTNKLELPFISEIMSNLLNKCKIKLYEETDAGTFDWEYITSYTYSSGTFEFRTAKYSYIGNYDAIPSANLTNP